MSRIEEFEREFKKSEIEYFKKYFMDKPLHEAIYDSYKKELMGLSGVYARFGMLKDILRLIKEEENLPEDLSNLVDEFFVSVTQICDSLNKILEPIADKM